MHNKDQGSFLSSRNSILIKTGPKARYCISSKLTGEEEGAVGGVACKVTVGFGT